MIRFFGIGILVSSVSFAAVENQIFPSGDLSELVVENETGITRIYQSETNQTQVKASKEQFGKNCSYTAKRVGKKLKIKIDSEASIGEHCRVNLDIAVPKAIDIDVKQGFGKVDISKTQGEIDLIIGGGEVLIDAEVKKLKAKSGTASIDVKGMNGEAFLKMGTGNLNLNYAKIPMGDLEIRSGTGNVRLGLPAASKVFADFKSGLGSFESEFPNDKKSQFKLSMESGTGSLTIRKIP